MLISQKSTSGKLNSFKSHQIRHRGLNTSESRTVIFRHKKSKIFSILVWSIFAKRMAVFQSAASPFSALKLISMLPAAVGSNSKIQVDNYLVLQLYSNWDDGPCFQPKLDQTLWYKRSLQLCKKLLYTRCGHTLLPFKWRKWKCTLAAQRMLMLDELASEPLKVLLKKELQIRGLNLLSAWKLALASFLDRKLARWILKIHSISGTCIVLIFGLKCI